MKLSSIILNGILVSGLLLSGCNKEKGCTTYTERKNSGHLINMEVLQASAPEIVDSLNKYPMLQAYKIQKGEGMLRVDCYVYYKEVRMFFSTYGLLKTGDGRINVVGNNVTDFDLNISFTPAISGLDAVERARHETPFGPDCLIYILGVLDMNTISGLPGHDYKLTWKVTTAEENSFVFVDAQTGSILSKSEPWQ